MDYDPDCPWYHGSPFELSMIREGSTITQNIDLARIFSHKPAFVSISDDGKIKHNGSLPGYLYLVDEHINPGDVVPHPQSTMAPGAEWLTRRDFNVQLLSEVKPVSEEELTGEDLASLKQFLDKR